ncbi:MAG: DNA-processing protein DprA [Hyphomicrobiaceae bacterium]|nr:DNA-processing protein DprA [Hyphomicrobiaceae bacterium]
MPEPGSLFTAAPLPQAPLDDAQRLACLRLIRSENVGPVTFRQLINHYGGAEPALAALPELARRGGRGRPIRITPRADAERELERARNIGAVPIFTIEPGYPPALASIEQPPPLLYVRGVTSLLARPAIAIVGSRQSSAAGLKLTRQFASGLAAAGYAIVSGLARGIDAAAHETSLERGTIAVVAGGVDIVYPPENAALHAAIGEQGAIVSEMPPGFVPRGRDFPRRNRIIAGVALGIVVIEAARRSGTLVTARYAVEHGRDVFAVPGHPLDPRAEGTNGLLKSGAIIATEPADVLTHMAPLSGLSPHPSFAEPDVAPWEPAITAEPPHLPGETDRNRVLDALGPAPVDIDAVARETGLPARTINVILMELELAGRICRQGNQLVARIA